MGFSITSVFNRIRVSALLSISIAIGTISLHAQTLPENGLIAHYPFFGNFNDITINNLNIPLAGTSKDGTFSTNRYGMPGFSGYFNGAGDMPMPSPNLSNPNTFTVSIWLRSEVVNERQPISGSNPVNEDFQYFDIQVVGGYNPTTEEYSNPVIQARFNDNIQPAFVIQTPAAASVWGNNWYFVTLVVDNGVPTLYVDDQSVTSQEPALSLNPMEWVLGNRASGDLYEYQGSVDDISIYDRALSYEEIQQVRSFAFEIHHAVPIAGVATDGDDDVFEGGETVFIDFTAGSIANPLVDITGIGLVFNLENTDNFTVAGAGSINMDYADNGILSVVHSTESSIAFGLTGTTAITSGIQPMFRVSLIAKAGAQASSSTNYWLENILLLNSSGESVITTTAYSSGSVLLTVIPSSTVWPGDTDNNGVVEIADVLPVGQYYLETGFDRGSFDVSWAGHEVDSWNNELATYADATGNGVVDQNDILPIGLNFGLTHGVPKSNSFASSPFSFDVELPAIPANSEVTITISAGNTTNQLSNILGFSATVRTSFIPESISNPVAGSFISTDNMLTYSKAIEGSTDYAFAISRTRQSGAVSGIGEIASITFKTNDAIVAGTKVSILNPMISTLTNITSATSLSSKVDWNLITSTENEVSLPTQVTLAQNYPNPFNPSTTIQFSIPTSSEIKLSVFDVMGREVMNVKNGILSAGSHTIHINASALSSGVYFYRLQTSTGLLQKTMTLIK